MNDDYIKAIMKILELQQQKENTQNNFLSLSTNQSIEEQLMNSLLNPIRIKKTGKYMITRQEQEVPLMEVFEGTVMNEKGFIEEIKKERYYTMPDGTSLGEYVECMNCGNIVHKESISRCAICRKTVCILCEKFSSGKSYCCYWHKFLGGDVF